MLEATARMGHYGTLNAVLKEGATAALRGRRGVGGCLQVGEESVLNETRGSHDDGL